MALRQVWWQRRDMSWRTHACNVSLLQLQVPTIFSLEGRGCEKPSGVIQPVRGLQSVWFESRGGGQSAAFLPAKKGKRELEARWSAETNMQAVCTKPTSRRRWIPVPWLMAQCKLYVGQVMGMNLKCNRRQASPWLCRRFQFFLMFTRQQSEEVLEE